MLYLIKNKHWEIDKDYNIDKLLYLLIDRPDFTNVSCEMGWCSATGIDDYRYYDLPAVVQEQLAMKSCNLWWYNTKCEVHRENNKPAILWHDNEKSYYLNDKLIKSEKNKE